jgi:tetratricopeptide (TPR) repeat protein
VIVLEAPAGEARLRRLEAWLEAVRREGARRAWLLRCDAARGGMWAGPGGWMESILPELESGHPALFRHHDAELAQVIPALRRRVCPRNHSLTDDAEGDESVRNYARDRAHRVGHGLIDLLDAWHAGTGGGRWALACDALDRSGALAGEFFRNLVRRRGHALGLVMLAAVEPGEGDALAAEMGAWAPVARVRMELEPGPFERPDPEEAARAAAELEPVAAHDTVNVRIHGHEMVRLWEAAGRTDRAVAWHGLLLGVLAHFGYYQDAFRHLAPVRANLSVFDGEGAYYNRSRILTNLRITYITNDQAEEARVLLETEGLAKLTDPVERARALYLLSMIHARHHPRRDLERAERYLHEGLAELDRATLESEERHFLTGFLLNGLAFVRMRQGNAGEAAALSHDNYDRLERHLPPGRHRLHRSILLYNAGQVYARTGEHERAVRHFSEAMAMDPNYSEYYNDRGNVYLAMGKLEEAEHDYRRAIELSPPYPEVWFNLGQCLGRMGRAGEACRAYERAVDLDPARPEPWTNLARLRHALGRREEALAAYDAAVAADGANPFVLANRAALRFELGRPGDALADLDRAVTLAPGNAALERNRARVQDVLARHAAEPVLN